MKPTTLAKDDESRLIACLDDVPFQTGAPLFTIAKQGKITIIVTSSSDSFSPEREVFFMESSHWRDERLEDIFQGELTTNAWEENDEARDTHKDENRKGVERRHCVQEHYQDKRNLDSAFEQVEGRNYNTLLEIFMEMLWRAAPKKICKEV